MTLAVEKNEATAGNEGAFTVQRVAGHIGAEVKGLDLSRPLDDEAVARLRRKLLKHKVLFFRDQHLGHAEQIEFGRRFGELTHAHPHEDAPPSDAPQILTIDPQVYQRRYGSARPDSQERQYSYYSGWHTDVTASVNPPAISILRSEVVPEFGGDTTWTNLVAAYEGLSEPLRKFADGLTAVHRFSAGRKFDDDEAYARRINDNLLISEHPVVRVHPETGERALFVNPGFTDHIVGVSPVESAKILELFFGHLSSPRYTVRFRWDAASVAVWDNRATAHLGPQDLGHLDVTRTLHRVTVVGDRPVGPDGFVSQIIAGEEFTTEAKVKVS